MSHARPDVVKELLDRYGRSYAELAGIRLRDTPAPLYQLLVLSTLPDRPAELARLAGSREQLPRLAAALVQVSVRRRRAADLLATVRA